MIMTYEVQQDNDNDNITQTIVGFIQYGQRVMHLHTLCFRFVVHFYFAEIIKKYGKFS